MVLYIVSIPDESTLFALVVVIMAWVFVAWFSIVVILVYKSGSISSISVNMPVVVWISFPDFVVFISHHHLTPVVEVVVISYSIYGVNTRAVACMGFGAGIIIIEPPLSLPSPLFAFAVAVSLLVVDFQNPNSRSCYNPSLRAAPDKNVQFLVARW